MGNSMVEKFDFIIVGSGSAGCVLANRLSKDPNNTVLLLESGGWDNSPWIHIPLGYGKHFENPKVNWMYHSEPEPETGNRKIFQPRGKVMGGSSSINGLVYIRGQAEDYDKWDPQNQAGGSAPAGGPAGPRGRQWARGPAGPPVFRSAS